MAKRGLVVTYYFPPAGGGGVQRWTKFIKYLSDQDWKFTVITAAVESESISDQSLLNDIPPETQIIRTENKSGKKSDLLKSIPRGYLQRWISAFVHVTDSRGKWNQEVIPLLNAEIRDGKYDALFISMPPYSTAGLAAYYTDKLDIPVILDMRDPWTINPYKIHPTSLHRYLDRRAEQRTISKIKYIISAYQSIIQDYKKFPQIKSCVITNGYDETDFTDLSEIELFEKDTFNLAFSGSFYSHLNRPDNLFKAIKKLSEAGIKIKFHHIGSSVLNLRQLADKYDISDCIKIWDYLNHKECLETLNAMDAYCVILDPKHANADQTIGGKVYEYLRLKKPIIGIVPIKGEAAALIEETKSGLICKDSTPAEIAKCLRRVIIGEHEFSYVGISKYSRENLSKNLDAFIAEIMNTSINKV